MKHVLIAYMTYYGNNRKCAELFAQILDSKSIPFELISLRDGQKPSKDWELLTLFAPVRIGNIVVKARRFLKRIDGSGKGIAMVITHGADLDATGFEARFVPVKPSEKLLARVVEKGMTKAADITYIKIQDQKGPPEEGFEEKLRDLACVISEAH